MFKRLKNWIVDHSASDHAVASFAWFGFSALTAGTAALFPAIAPIALGTATVASKIGVLEGIFTGAHVVSGILSWCFGKLFKRKAKSAASKSDKADTTKTKSEKSNEKTNQKKNSDEKSETQEANKTQEAVKTHEVGKTQETPVVENAQPDQPTIPVMQEKQQDGIKPNMQPTQNTDWAAQPQQQQNLNATQVVQIPSAQLSALIRQIQILSAQVRQMQQEIAALRLENQNLRRRAALLDRQMEHRPQTSEQRRRIIVHRHYVLNGRPVHE